MSYMWAGKILDVDLTKRDFQTIPTSHYAKRFLGGRGINSKLLFENVSEKVGPLEPENVLIIGTGPFAGTIFPGSSRLNILTKSPMTGLEGSSNIGGMGAAELKFAGYDHLLIRGRADSPVVLFIDNEQISFLDAKDLWGKDTYETVALLRKELKDPEIQILTIGQAGENQVHYASILSKFGNAAGRTGSGAVMGSKNLKAIAIRGTKGIRVSDSEGYARLAFQVHKMLSESSRGKRVRLYGTTKSSDGHASIGGSPVLNFRSTSWDGYENTRAYNFFVKYFNRRTGCFGCPTHCMENYKIEGVGNGIVSCMGYRELSDKIMLEDQEAWWRATVLCQRHGLDVASAGGMLAFAMELFEKGIITTEDTDGISMHWGEPEAIYGMLTKIIKRDGFGDILAHNPIEAARMIGHDVGEYAMHAKGLPLYQRNQQSYRGRTLSLAVDPRGDAIAGRPALESSFLKAFHSKDEKDKKVLERYYKLAEKITGNKDALEPLSYDGKAELVKFTQDVVCSSDILGNCRSHTMWSGLDNTVDFFIQADLLSAGLGEEVTVKDILLTVERVFAVERSFAVREGVTREKDKIPERLFKESMEGFFAGDLVNRELFEKMKDNYYKIRGWNIEKGIPSKSLLSYLELDDVARELEAKDLLVDNDMREPLLFLEKI